MNKTIIVATCVAALSLTAGAFAQTTGPASQSDNMSKGAMSNDGMKKEGSTTGMTDKDTPKTGASSDGMSKDMSKNGGQGSDPAKTGMSK